MLTEQKQQVRVHIRWMIKRDMPEVLQIENNCFEFPWTEEDFLRCLRQRNHIGMVSESKSRIVGFMIYELQRTKLHVVNFAVQKALRRHGIGSQMVSRLISKLQSRRKTGITLKVRETNVGAQKFFYENGFRAIEILHDFFDDITEDAYLMRYRRRLTREEKIWRRALVEIKKNCHNKQNFCEDGCVVDGDLMVEEILSELNCHGARIAFSVANPTDEQLLQNYVATGGLLRFLRADCIYLPRL